MRLLYHDWLHPGARMARIVLGEFGLESELEFEKWWDRRPEFLKLNPAAEVPVLIEEPDIIVCGTIPVIEYLDERYGETPLMGQKVPQRAEVRRLVEWFHEKLNREVTRPLTDEKVLKRFLNMGEPNSGRLRGAQQNLKPHLDYITWLSERRTWLAGDDFSMADVAAAAHLSCLDYLGDVPWKKFPEAASWYARVKSRKSLRPLLSDRIAGLAPPKHYDDLDF